MFNEYKDMLTVAEVSVMLNICPGKTYKLLNEGKILAFRCEKTWCIPKENVINYINEHLNNSTFPHRNF